MIKSIVIFVLSINFGEKITQFSIHEDGEKIYLEKIQTGAQKRRVGLSVANFEFYKKNIAALNKRKFKSDIAKCPRAFIAFSSLQKSKKSEHESICIGSSEAGAKEISQLANKLNWLF